MPTVGGTHFKYDKAGMQKAKAWSEITGKPMQMDKKSKGRKYQPGGQVSSRVTADVLEPSSLDEVAHKVLPESTRARYTARTKGGEQRHLTQEIKGVGGRKDRRRVALMALRDAIKNNPDFVDTVSFQKAKAFIENKNPSLWDKFLDLIMGMTEGPQQNNNLAAMGRNGDTMIRPVNGQPSHVNPIEANMIDNLGPAGQKMTQAVGSGTRNPETGLKEYHPAGAWWKMAHPQHHGEWWTGDTEEFLGDVADVASDVGESIGENVEAAGNWAFGQGSMADTFWDWAYYGCVGEQIGNTCYMTDEEYDFSQTLSDVQDVINTGLNIGAMAWGQGEGPLVWVDSDGNIQTADLLGDWGGQGITDLDNYEWAEGTPAACQGEMTPAKLQACYEAGGTDLTEQQLSDLQDEVDEYEDEFFENLEDPEEPPPEPPPPPSKALNTWGFSKFGEHDSDWLQTLNQLLGQNQEQKPSFFAQRGGQVPSSRRMPKYQEGGITAKQDWAKSDKRDIFRKEVTQKAMNKDEKDMELYLAEALLQKLGLPLIRLFAESTLGERTATLQGKPIPFQTAQNAISKLLEREITGKEFKPDITAGPAYQTGGQVPQGRRTYGSPMKYSMKGKKKRRPRSLQTANVGPMRGMRPGVPMMKKGGMPKGCHT